MLQSVLTSRPPTNRWLSKILSLPHRPVQLYSYYSLAFRQPMWQWPEWFSSAVGVKVSLLLRFFLSCCVCVRVCVCLCAWVCVWLCVCVGREEPLWFHQSLILWLLSLRRNVPTPTQPLIGWSLRRRCIVGHRSERSLVSWKMYPFLTPSPSITHYLPLTRPHPFRPCIFTGECLVNGGVNAIFSS